MDIHFHLELQIGSIVKIETTALYENFDRYKTEEKDNLWVVRTLGYNVELERLYNPSHETTITADNNHIAPIGLSVNWAKRLGYDREEGCDDELHFKYEDESCIVKRKDDHEIYYTGGKGCTLSRKLEYVHQLQLLTTAICGKQPCVAAELRYK